MRERARQRRLAWRGGKVELAAAEQQDAEFWQALTPADRLVTVWSLSLEAYGTPDAIASGLRGSTSGIRRL